MKNKRTPMASANTSPRDEWDDIEWEDAADDEDVEALIQNLLSKEGNDNE